MTNKNIRLMCLVIHFITPYSAEEAIQISNNNGNMEYHGLFLDIYNKRNLHYFSLITFYPCYLYNYRTFGIIFLFLTFYLFFISCNRCFTLLTSINSSEILDEKED
uniref:Uncharacterized protein n=1 Tax=viral metagenome TaxID=1070528 RepID=A0A6C0KXR5_9ZZZZ